MERIEDLMLNGLKIYQDDQKYCFTSDAVLLAKFARVKKGDVVADFCSGSGIVGLHLYGQNADKIKSVTLFEMQSSLYNLSKKSIELNGLNDKIFAVNSKVQDIDANFNGKFSLIVCNPPYAKIDAGEHDENFEIDVCRREVFLTLPELTKAIARCLKFKGRVNIVHRADRLVEVITELKKHNIEPKRLQFVSGKNKAPYLFMIEGVLGGKSGLLVCNNIIN